MKAIVEAADVSPRTFFRYFPCKEDVITAIAVATMDDTLDHLSGHDVSEPLACVLKAMLSAALARVSEDPDTAEGFQMMLLENPVLRGTMAGGAASES